MLRWLNLTANASADAGKTGGFPIKPYLARMSPVVMKIEWSDLDY